MGRSTSKDNRNDMSIDKNGLKQILGRIFRPRHVSEGEETVLPFLLVKERTVRVELEQVIQTITENPARNDNEILGLVGVPGVKPADIEMARAYIHRFGTDLANPLSIVAHPERTLLLDENTPQPAMLHLSRQFGWATHVSAEGLSGRDTPDVDIWDFAHAHQFAAIVTRDTDFFYIQKHRGEEALDRGDENIPLLIFVPETLSTEKLSGLFSQHGTNIRRHMKLQNLACSLSDEKGCRELHL